MHILLPIFITSLGYTFWLWSRGGRLPMWPREIDELDQAMHRPFASPLLFIAGATLTIYGLYRSYLIGWDIVLVSFFVGAFLGIMIFRFVIHRLIS